MSSITTKQSLHDTAQTFRDVDLELSRLKEDLVATESRLVSLKQNVVSAKEHKEKCFQEFLAKHDRISLLKVKIDEINEQIQRAVQTHYSQLDELFAAASDKARSAELEHIAARSLSWTDMLKYPPYFCEKEVAKKKHNEELIRAKAEIIGLERDYERAVVSYAKADDEFTTLEGIWYTQKEFLGTVEKRREMVKYYLCGAAGLYAGGLLAAQR